MLKSIISIFKKPPPKQRVRPAFRERRMLTTRRYQEERRQELRLDAEDRRLNQGRRKADKVQDVWAKALRL